MTTNNESKWREDFEKEFPESACPSLKTTVANHLGEVKTYREWILDFISSVREKAVRSALEKCCVRYRFKNGLVSEKKCPGCGEVKGLDQFYKNEWTAFKVTSHCKNCLNKRGNDRYHKIKPKILAKNRPKYEELKAEGKLTYHSNVSETPFGKNKSRAKLRYEVKMGRALKLPCLICNNPKTQAHHPDYSKPLWVAWLCIKHHTVLHSKHDPEKDAVIKSVNEYLTTNRK